MSDEPSRLAEGMTAVPPEGRRVENPACEHPGCGKDAGFGFARPRQAREVGVQLVMVLASVTSLFCQQYERAPRPVPLIPGESAEVREAAMLAGPGHIIPLDPDVAI